MAGRAGATFRERAWAEARRYGDDPFIFVRELLQNARDAGARHVRFHAECADGVERVSCRDDGAGMSFAAARRFLLTLYASSKEREPELAGRFGVGFWAVLRFEPQWITVRSSTDGAGWELRLDGALERAEQGPAAIGRGTEVVLERPARGVDLAAEVAAAVRRDAPYLRCAGEPERRLEVTVNGELAGLELELPPPSLTFRRRGMRGAVALGTTPRVDLFAHGLRVRTAAVLDELLLADHDASPRPLGASDGLVPRVVLDGDRVEPLLARADAREDRSLRRLVRVAGQELERLVRGELDRAIPPGVGRRVWETVEPLLGRRWLRRTVLVLVAGTLLGLGLVALLGDRGAVQRLVSARGGDEVVPSAQRPYADLSERYPGPRVAPLAGAASSVDLAYRPASARPGFAALLVVGLDRQGRVVAPGAGTGQPPGAADCAAGCVEVSLGVDAAPGLLRLPTPSGQVVDAASVRLDGRPLAPILSPEGLAAVELASPARGRLVYRTGAGRSRFVVGSWPSLPEPLAARAAALRDLRLPDRVAAAVGLVRSLVTYDRSAATARRHEALAGLPFVERCLNVGAGDCDVQNGVLAAVLAATGVSCRLAIGYQGRDGHALPGLHAWVEVLAADGSVLVADASGQRTAEAAPAAGGASGTRDRAHPRLSGRVIPLALAVVATVAVALLLLGRSRVSRRWEPGADLDLASLLRGALRQPEAMAAVRPLYSRPLVPLLGGRRISLRRAQLLADRGLLAAGRALSPLASAVARRGVAVVDAARAEGLAVAEALGARDLDRWDRLLGQARVSSLTAALEERLARVGERLQVRLVEGVAAPLSFLELPGVRVVLVDTASGLARAAAERAAPLALLLLADAVAHHVELPSPRRSRLLAALAREAVLAEEAG